MKKNKLFRLLTLALTLVFLCQFAIPAFAYTSESWPNGSYWYHLETYINGTRTKWDVPISTASVYHYSGDWTNLWGYYDLSYTENWSNDAYGDELMATLTGTAHDNTHRKNNVEMNDACGGIPGYEPEGTYYICTEVYCNRVGYTVYQEGEYGDNEWDVGEVLSPYDFGNTALGYSLASG